MAAGICLALLACGVLLAVSLSRDGSSISSRSTVTAVIGPEGGQLKAPGLRVDFPRGTFPSGTRVRVRQLPVDRSKERLPGSVPQSDTFEVVADRKLEKPVQVRFRLSPDLPARDHQRLVSSAREERRWVPAIRLGRVESDEFVISTRRFSWLGLEKVPQAVGSELQRAKRAARQVVDDLEEVIGARSEPPTCANKPVDAELSVSDEKDPDDPLLYACLDREGGAYVVRVNNNRAVALEFTPPAGMSVRAESASLSEEAWDRVFAALPESGNGRLVPGGGSLILEGELPEEPVTFEPTASIVSFDLAVSGVAKAGKATGALKGSALGVTGAGAEFYGYASCAYRATRSVREPSAETVPNVLGECGQVFEGTSMAIVSAILAGTTYEIVDALGVLTGGRATVSFKKKEPRRLPRVQRLQRLMFQANSMPARIGDFDILAGDRTIGDAVEAFGEPDSADRSGVGCVILWRDLGIKANAANLGEGIRDCSGDSAFIHSFVITSPAFSTDAGLRVGMSEGELLRRHPRATTRSNGTEPTFDEKPVSSGSLYTIKAAKSPIGTAGFIATLKALVSADGQVRALEVLTYLAGE